MYLKVFMSIKWRSVCVRAGRVIRVILHIDKSIVLIACRGDEVSDYNFIFDRDMLSSNALISDTC